MWGCCFPGGSGGTDVFVPQSHVQPRSTPRARGPGGAVWGPGRPDPSQAAGPRLLRVPTLTLNFLYPHFPGNEDDHEVTGQTHKLPPELKRRGQGERTSQFVNVAMTLGC